MWILNGGYKMIQKVIPEMEIILKAPIKIGTTHQSVFRDSQVLNYIMKMVDRGDSKETIKDAYYFLTSQPDIKPETLQTFYTRGGNVNKD